MQYAAFPSLMRAERRPLPLIYAVCCTVSPSLSPSSSSMEGLSGTGWLAEMPRPRPRGRPRARPPRGRPRPERGSSSSRVGAATVGALQSSSRTRIGPCRENVRDCYGVIITNSSPMASPCRRMDAHPPRSLFSPVSSPSDVPPLSLPRLMFRTLGGHDQLVVQHHGPQQILTSTPPHMTSLAGTLKLHVTPLLTSAARDVVEEGEAAQNLKVFGQMPLIDNGPLIYMTCDNTSNPGRQLERCS
jgi:hypothetical protein